MPIINLLNDNFLCGLDRIPVTAFFLPRLINYSSSQAPTAFFVPFFKDFTASVHRLTPPCTLQGGSMPNTSSSVPYLLSSSMQSIRSRRPSAVLGGSQGSGLLQQLGSGMVRLTSSHQPVNGRAFTSSTVRKCPSLNITFS